MSEQMQQFETPSNEWETLNDGSVKAWLKEAGAGEEGKYLRATEIGRRVGSEATEKEIEERLDRATSEGFVDRNPDGDVPRYRLRSP